MNLENITVGDKLAYPSGLKSVRYDIYTVERITATQVVCGDVRFRKSNGRKVGRDLFNYAILATEQILSEHAVQHQRAAAYTKARARFMRLSLDARKFNTDQLNAICDLVESFAQ